MPVISTRLREINYYAGLVFDEQIGAALNELLDNREVKLRDLFGDSFITTAPTLEKGPLAGQYQIRMTDLEGVTANRPIYKSGVVDMLLETADSGTLLGPTVVVGGAGYSRYIVVTAEWVGNNYTQRTDDNKQTVFLYTDDGVLYRVFMGVEHATAPVIPTADLVAQKTATGAVPVAVVRRYFGDAEVQTAEIFNHDVDTHLTQDLVETVRSVASLALSNHPCGSLRQILTTPATEDDLRVFSATVAAATNGGTITTPAISGFYAVYVDNKLHYYDPSRFPFTSEDMDVSSVYFLRMQIDEFGAVQVYLQKGTLPQSSGVTYDAIPATLKGTPGGASGGGFPSTARDLVLGVVQTGTAGTVPTWTPFYHGDFIFTSKLAYDSGSTYVGFTITKPFACDYQIDIRFDEGNFNPAPPTGFHTLFIPIGSEIDYYNWTHVELNAHGKWLEDQGTGLQIPIATPLARPAMSVTVRPKHRLVS